MFDEKQVISSIQWYKDLVNNSKIPTYQEIKESIPNRFAIFNVKDHFNNFEVQSSIRHVYVERFGFCLINEGMLNDIAEYLNGKKVLEIGSGNGFLAKCLQDKGIDVFPTDDLSWESKGESMYSMGWKDKHYTEIEKLDYHAALKKYIDDVDAALLSWPVYGDRLAYNVLKVCLSHDKPLIYIGEQEMGCTADDYFFDYIDNPELSFEPLTRMYIPFYGMYDDVYLIQKINGGE